MNGQLQLTGQTPTLASDVIERSFPFGSRSLDGCVHQGKCVTRAEAHNHRVVLPDVTIGPCARLIIEVCLTIS